MLKLSRKWKVHDVFYVSLLEQDITRKRRVDKKISQIIFDVDDNDSGKYKVEAIWDSVVYAREFKSGHPSGFYYLASWERYLEEKNT